ncbi:hypothetical protein [Paraglaciecola sp.]
MKKCKIICTAILFCFLASGVQAGPAKQKPPMVAESSFFQTVIEFLGLTE